VHIKLIDLVGFLGGFFILLAFYRTSIGRWKGRSFWYELDNLVGAALMCVYAYSKTAYVSILLNSVWVLVAFVGVSSYAERRVKKVVKKEAKKLRRARSHRRAARRLIS
jgi:hypothetical protein